MDRYLTNQLIAYIGNKRALLPFLKDVFAQLDSRGRIKTFLDPFSGSGAVSRLGKWLGYRVFANDWEPYSFVVNLAHVEIDRNELAELFKDDGGISRVVDYLNHLPPVEKAKRYVSHYYAPRNTDNADYKRERLFYTTENALRIDTVREKIEELYPLPCSYREEEIEKIESSEAEFRVFKKKQLLLASLLYQCATHTNTSGVFKAYHRGFGGYGGDALKRIMGRIWLEEPVVIDSKAEKSSVSIMDAKDFVKDKVADLCYLDPPYNQHQYGSNYHLLNTIAIWDKPDAPLKVGSDGRLVDKAGIRKDWKRTRSPFCYRDSAISELKVLVERINARFIAISYNTEGIIPLDILLDVFEREGRTDIYTSDYTKYRGGKQSIAREVSNMELLIVSDRSERGRGDRNALKRKLLVREILLAMKASFNPEKVESLFRAEGGRDGRVFMEWKDRERTELPMPFLYRFSPVSLERVTKVIDFFTLSELEVFNDKLKRSRCRNRREELEIVLGILKRDGEELSLSAEYTVYQRRVLWLLKKFAFKKYRDVFQEAVASVEGLVAENPENYEVIGRGLREIKRIASLRFNG